uniref:ALBINO3-like protein 2, chloroplastic n=1 Tax=Chenopodium quinoa TaxID=63459 RepID=A0A803L4B3_CHEQI
MATSRLISGHLRRNHFSLLRPFLLSLSSSPHPSPPLPTTSDHTPSFFPPSTTSFRYFSSQPSGSDFTHQLNSVTESELRRLGFIDGSQISDVVDRLLDDSVLPIRYFVSVLDGFHDLTGLPWWIVIASSTVAMRITLFPWIVLQLHKMKQIGEMLPKLPPPIPLPFSGKSYVDQFSLFRRERQALGCPSYLWFLASFAVQIPCFILWMASIRKMSLDLYPGFDTEGILWFQNLTEVPNGPFGPILPLLIAVVQEVFGISNITDAIFRISYAPGKSCLLGDQQFSKPYSEAETDHLASLVAMNENLCLQNPAIRQRLGVPLPSKGKNVDVDHEKNVSGSALLDAPTEHGHVSAFNLSSEQLVNLSVSYLCAGRVNRALPLLRLALDKDPECYSALTVMGQTMLQLKDYENAAEYLESAISKISLAKPTDAESIDFLIQASMSAGAAYYRQGKVAESFTHFERMKDIEVPEEATVKDRYYEGIMCFASFLRIEGRKEESDKYLRMACAYDPKYSVYLENLKKDTDKGDNFVAELASSRRADY